MIVSFFLSFCDSSHHTTDGRFFPPVRHFLPSDSICIFINIMTVCLLQQKGRCQRRSRHKNRKVKAYPYRAAPSIPADDRRSISLPQNTGNSAPAPMPIILQVPMAVPICFGSQYSRIRLNKSGKVELVAPIDSIRRSRMGRLCKRKLP